MQVSQVITALSVTSFIVSQQGKNSLLFRHIKQIKKGNALAKSSARADDKSGYFLCSLKL